MDAYQKISELVDEFFRYIISGFQEPRRVSNWRTLLTDGKYFIHFDLIIGFAEELEAFTSEKISGMKKAFLLSGFPLLNPDRGESVIHISFCLNDMKFYKSDDATIGMCLNESDFSFSEPHLPTSWSNYGHKPIAGIQPNTNFCYIFLLNSNCNADGAISHLQKIRDIMDNTYTRSKENASGDAEERLKELRDLLG